MITRVPPCRTKGAISRSLKKRGTSLARRSPQTIHAPVRRTSHDRKIIRNEILLSTIDTEFSLIQPHLEHVVISAPKSLCEPQELFRFAYFPNDGVISIVVVMPNGKTVEAGLVGKEGVVGLPAIEGFKRSPLREVVQISGDAFRVKISTIRKILASAPIFDGALTHYSLLFGLQIAQTAACNRLHDTEKRLARWLLMAEDRVDSRILHITHDFLATMLGTDRSSVSIAAATLQKLNLIQYRRGAVKVLNRSQLEGYACDCYRAIQSFNANEESFRPRKK